MTVQALYDEFQKKCALDPELRALKQKIESGSADFNDTAAYSQRVSKLLGKTLSKHIDSIPASQREKICKWLLQEQYKDTNSICEVVQMALDEAQGIHLKPVKPKFPAERVQQVAHALEDPTVKPEVIQRRANAPVANVSMSFHDDYIKENAKIRAKLGMKPTITRYGSGCCSWCSAVAGKYRFGEQPKDVFRRHDNCDCTIIYDNQVLRGRETSSGRSKTWEEVDPKSVEALGFAPTVNSPEQAKKLQEKALEQLTKPGQGDIINSADNIELFGGLFTDTQKQALNEALKPIPHKLLNQLANYVSNISIIEGRGYSSYQEISRQIILDKEKGAAHIVHELGHAFGDMRGLYENEKFLKIVSNDLNLDNWGEVLPFKHPHKDDVIYILSPSGTSKFIIPYQGRIYGDMTDWDSPIEPNQLKEYISVGFDAFFNKPDVLLKKDPALYHYLEECMHEYID